MKTFNTTEPLKLKPHEVVMIRYALEQLINSGDLEFDQFYAELTDLITKFDDKINTYKAIQ